MYGKTRSKEELRLLAEKVVNTLLPEKLPAWQVEEVLRIAQSIARNHSLSLPSLRAEVDDGGDLE